MTQLQNILTCGDWDEEAAGLGAFDAAIERCGAFKVYREVWGTYIQPRFDVEQKRARIDRILVPTRKAVDAGWRDGPLGVEAKKSGTKLGKIVSQSLDYSRCGWDLGEGFCVLLRWVFVWPLSTPGADLESIMAQNRIGWVQPGGNARLVFGCGGMHGITVYADGTLTAKRLPMGRKVGSR